MLFYPKEVALQLLPLGIPAGLAENKPLAQDLIDHVKKYIPLLRNPIFKLESCADWLEGWVQGTLPDLPLLDVSAVQIMPGPCVASAPSMFAHGIDAFTVDPNRLKLKGPEQKLAIVKSYTTRAKVRIVHRAAASAWMQGVPWSEALEIATKALRTADGTPRKLVFAKRGKGKGRGKGSGKAKG